LLMHRRDGMPLKQIAIRLGVSHTMVKRYLAKALSYCQQHLEEKE
jgi:DNA-directed RNA polymerase specialized sigma24 family protein